MDIEPVTIIDMGDVQRVRESIVAALAAGNQQIPTPPRAEEPGSVVLDKVGIKRWEAFERDAVLYSVHCAEDGIAIFATGRGADGMWTADQDKKQLFDPDTPLADIAQTIVHNMLERPELAEREPTLPMLLPPPKET